MIRRAIEKIYYETGKIQIRKEEKAISKLFNSDHKPIYHVHVRKTGGTTINFAFLSNSNYKNVEVFYEKLAKKNNHRIIANNKVFVGWNEDLIQKGQYSYAFSHTPLHQLKLSKNIFQFTCLRDPCSRVLSHYNMLKYYVANNNHPCVKTEGKWLGNSFGDFMDNLPKEHLHNQIFMFSKNYNLNEAIENLLHLDSILFTEDLKEGLLSLEKSTDWNLPISNQKKYGHKETISTSEKTRLRDILSPEYDLLENIKKHI